MTKGIGRLAGLLVCGLALAAPALAGGRSRPHTSSAARTGATGCPEGGPLTATPPQQCLAIPSELVTIVTNRGQSCVVNDYVQVKVPKRLSYEAVWYSTIGLGTRWWTNPGTGYPRKVTGLGARYKVPKGWEAWSGAGGSGPRPCSSSPPAGTYGVAGWALVGCDTTGLGDQPASRSTPTEAADSDSSPTSQQDERWRIQSDMQTKIFAITQDVCQNKAQTKDKAFRKWDEYIRDGKIKSKIKLPGKLSSPLTLDISIHGPNTVTHGRYVEAASSRNITVAQESLTLEHTGNVTLNVRFTSAGRALMRRWLAADRQYIAQKSGKPPTVALTSFVNGYDPSSGWPAPLS